MGKLAKSPSETPPPYSGPSPFAAGPSSSAGPVPDIARCNLLAVRRAADIAGTFVLDPRMRVPAALLPPLDPAKPAAVRASLELAAKGARVDADVWLVPSAAASAPPTPAAEDGEASASDDGKMDADSADAPQYEKGAKEELPERATLVLAGRHVSLTLRTPSHAPFVLTIAASDSLVLSIPRTFAGPLTIRAARGPVVLSPALSARAATFADVDGVRRCFVGDPAALEAGPWSGSEVDVGVKSGKVTLRFVDEVDEAPRKSRWGW